MTHLIYRNTIFLLASEGFTALAAALAGLMAARLLPVEEFGEFSAAFAFAQIMAVLVDSGMGALIAKTIAREPRRGMANVDAYFTWRVLTIVGVSILGPFLAHFILPTALMRRLALMLTPALMLLTMTDFISWIFKAIQKAHWCLVLQAGSRFLLVALCAFALLSRHKLPWLLMAYAVAGIAATAFGLWLLAKVAHVAHLVKLPASFFTHALPDIYKLGGIIILKVGFSRLDVMLVAKYCGVQQTGLFSAASRVLDGLRMMPTVALGICLPLFCAAHNDMPLLRSRFLKSYMALVCLSTALALIAYAFSGPLFAHLLGGSYAPAALIFRPLVWSCVLMYANMIMFALLYALNDHRTVALAITSAVILNVGLNVVLLPRVGLMAAPWDRLIAEGLNFAILANSVLRKRVASPRDLIVMPVALILCTIGVLICLRNTPVSYQCLAAGLTYTLLLWAMNPRQLVTECRQLSLTMER